MKILALDEKHGIVKLAVENRDDLWHLYNIVEKGDTIRARTSREIKETKRTGVADEGRRVNLVVGLEVEDTEFHRFTGKLRIHGRIREAPDKFDGLTGAHHSVMVTLGDAIIVEKEKLTRLTRDRLKRASRIKRPSILIAAVEDGDAAVAIYRGIGLDVLLNISRHIPGKMAEDDSREVAKQKFFSEILTSIHEAVQREQKLAALLVVGPGFWKNEFAAYAKEHEAELAPRITLENAYSGGVPGVNEALGRQTVRKILRDSLALQERIAVDDLYAQLTSEEGKVAYGLPEIEKACEYGAVDTLLVSETLMKEPSATPVDVEKLMVGAEQKGGKVRIIGDDEQARERLDSLGGVAAILRFRLN